MRGRFASSFVYYAQFIFEVFEFRNHLEIVVLEKENDNVIRSN